MNPIQEQQAGIGVTAAAGFIAAGVAAGLKSSGKLDVALVVNTGPQKTAAAVFTSNTVAAAPVLWSRQAVSDGLAEAVVLNSGGANACTGPEGFANTHRGAEYVAELLGISALDVLVCSTGLIGVPLPMDKLTLGIQNAVSELSAEGGPSVAEAVMTTDSVPKTVQRTTASGYTVGGMAKGAGMLAPGLATMLSVITTDALLDPETADQALRQACRSTFDRIDADGCMSTNDTVILLASGASGIQAEQSEFTEELRQVCAELAKKLIDDAEGAEHQIAITTTGAPSEEAAVEVSRAIARSNLFKTAIFGQDPNWGRVLSAAGSTTVRFDPNAVNVSINQVMVCRGGAIGEDRELVDLSAPEVQVDIDLAAGDGQATIWTNDLTTAYVHENSAYSS